MELFKARRDRSLYRLLGGIIVAAVVLVLGGEAAYTYRAQQQRMMEEMEEHTALSLATLQKNLASFIESYAANEYGNLVATEIELRQHFAIIVSDYSMGRLLGREAYVSGKIRNPSGAVIDFDPADAAHRQWLAKAFFSASTPIAAPSGAELGRVAVYGSDAEIKAELERILVRTLAKTVAILALLSALLLLAIRHLLIGPLARITAVLEQHDSDGIPTAPIPRIAYREISPLTDTMNTMVEVVKQSRASLKTERTRLLNVVEGTHVGTWEWNVQTGEVVFNERWAGIVGYTLEELAPPSIDTWTRLAHPEDLQQSEALLKRHFAGELPYYECEMRMRHRQGHWVWLLDRGRVATWTEDGKPLLMSGTHQEITERKQAEVALRQAMAETERLLADSDRLRRASLNMLEDQRQAERRLDEFFEQPLHLHLIARLDGVIVRANIAWHQLLGYEPLALEGHSFMSLVHPEDRAKTQAELGRLNQGETTLIFENRYRHADGGYRSLAWSAVASPEERLIYGVASDITERRQAEAELEQHRHHLEELVVSRTAELERARVAAEAANRAKSVFLANMSHELRTPLNAILGFAQVLERDPSLGAEQHQELATINRSGQHLLALINDVLDISRIEAGRVELQRQSFDLGALLLGVEEMARIRAEARGLALRVECGAGLPPHVEGDAHHLRQVLINLLGNAVKYTDRGEVTLRALPEPGRIRFEVADTGPGIPPDEQARIFDPFYQTAVGIARGEGAGLGLSLSRQFVRLMGGELEVESTLGQGSLFRFTLPLASAEAPVAPVRGRVLGLEPGQPPCRVLVAEDHPDSRALIRLLLEGMGFEVCTADDGGQAIAAFESCAPHLILMDMRMPGVDGYQATRRIRALPGGDGVRIVALTASAFREERQAILDAGCDELVHKPIEGDRLFEVMEALLGLRFRYEEPLAAASPAQGDIHLLPEEVLSRLAQSAEGLDEAGCLEIAGELAETHPDEARLIRELVGEFRFDQLLARISRHGS